VSPLGCVPHTFLPVGKTQLETENEMKEVLLDLVLQQIAKDVEAGDMTAIAELIADIPDNKAMHFLPEDAKP
jgi:hypothetical protein